MSLPLGGIADKLGNKYEYNYVVLSIDNEKTEYLNDIITLRNSNPLKYFEKMKNRDFILID